MSKSLLHRQAQVLPLLLTMGDPAGIGPEIVVKAFCERPELQQQMVVVGDVKPGQGSSW